ncbi:uncharacterized protein BX664DRAFT_254485 [Halteromyces radiatus]|uniref:uncharacterized protein n=1 Tax=Halteromyces radiatus TaxID=101107 RepID=UPI002220E596|nr:uncharacterized protein BX664DRAFT_254485 [Halteromyces radiatus]KAI8098727.1 hypothetical protein BX664DRAFT_254485 [Halteromyces radiatus]
MSGSGNIKVVVRCRPLNSKELARGATNLVRMEGNQTIVSQPSTPSTGNNNRHRDQNNHGNSDDIKAFTFDRSFWSVDPNSNNYASQETVYEDLGQELLDHAFHGYNCCIFAYGQTGSGKSYTMMGYGEDKGIIPKTCAELFSRIASTTDEVISYQVEVSYLEIYNEKVRDLLNPRNKSNLKVREHPSLGPYVEDLSRLAVKSFDDIDHLMNEGNKARTVAATNMNETSSRSHAVFTIFLTSKKSDPSSKQITEKVSRISLVDLAGSERADSTGATGARLKEGANINRSLATLGKVIAALAEKSSTLDTKKNKKTKEHFIPYRDSVLTWLLKDCLGGNSRTAMIAAISPADYEETLSTLRYADQAKRIKNKPVINEDPNAKLIRELKEELQALRDTLMAYAPEEVEKIASHTSPSILGSKSTPLTSPSATAPTRTPSPGTPMKEISFSDAFGVTRKMTMAEMVEQLKASQKLLDSLNQTWEEKLAKSQEVHNEREKALVALGILLERDNGMGIHTPKQIPHLVNLNEDPLMTECLVYQIKPGITRVGRFESDNMDIRLSGPNIMDGHCYFENNDGVVTIFPTTGSMTMVNGLGITEQKRLHNGYRIILGDYHVFRFNHPEEVRKERDRMNRSDSPALFSSDRDSGNYSISASGPPDIVDWNFAKREAVLNYYNGNSVNGDFSKRISLMDDETMSRTTTSSIRFSNGSLPLSMGIQNDDDNSIKRGNRYSGSQLSIDTGIYSALDGLSTILSDNNSQSSDIQDMEMKLQRVVDNMHRMMEKQKQAYESKIMRLSSKLPLDVLKSPLSPLYSPTEQKLASDVIKQWRRLHYVLMAEAILVHSIILKEANIIAKDLGKNVSYQFTVIHDNAMISSRSFWESTSALQQHESFLSTNNNTAKPCVGVQVIDKKHDAIYYWSLPEIKRRLKRMQSLYDFTDRPLSRTQFNWKDPFCQTPCPRFTLIGLASVPMRNLALQVSVESTVDIYNRNSCLVMGQLRLLITPIARSTNRSYKRRSSTSYLATSLNSNHSTNSSVLSESLLSPGSTSSSASKNDSINDSFPHVGQQQVFEIQILELFGLDENLFTQVHAQIRLSCFGNIVPHSDEDKIYATEPMSGFGTGPIYFNHTQTLTSTITNDMLNKIMTENLTVEIYGQARPEHLYSIIERHIEREKAADTSSSTSTPDTIPITTTSPSSAPNRRMRLKIPVRSYTDDGLLLKERHHVVAWVQVFELGEDGEYSPVNVVAYSSQDQGCFYLRQGLQRRIRITMVHDSGLRLPWKNITNMNISNVILSTDNAVDDKSKLKVETDTSAQSPVSINLYQDQPLEYNRDGTSVLIAQGPWDSSLHDSIHLNRITPPQQRIRTTLSWEVTCDKCTHPLSFSMNLSMRIHSRDLAPPCNTHNNNNNNSSSSAILHYFSSAFYQYHHMSSKLRGLFSVHLTPPLTRQVSQLWRVNTANRYVRGEELLGPERRLRGISLIEDYRKARKRMIMRQQVLATRHTLTLMEQQHKRQQHGDMENKTVLVQKVIRLWNCQFGLQQEIIINHNPPSPTSPQSAISNSSLRPIKDADINFKLAPQIQYILPSDTVTKKGYLFHPQHAENETWIKHWFTLRRPFIMVYQDQTEIEEIAVIDLTRVRVEHRKDLEDLIQKPNAFAIYTTNNAYLFQAKTTDDMIDWITKVDQFYPVDTLKS